VRLRTEPDEQHSAAYVDCPPQTTAMSRPRTSGIESPAHNKNMLDPKATKPDRKEFIAIF